MNCTPKVGHNFWLCQYLHNNKAAGLRARKVSLELEKKLKEFRKTSLAAAAK